MRCYKDGEIVQYKSRKDTLDWRFGNSELEEVISGHSPFMDDISISNAKDIEVSGIGTLATNVKPRVYTFYFISKIVWLCHIATTQKNW